MKVLHISDLHVTHRDTTLEQVWIGPAAVLPNKEFDYVVVSGDLSNRATKEEYGKLLEFAKTCLLPLLVREQRARVIFVPGNHDVDWIPDVYVPIRISALPNDEHKTLRGHVNKLKSGPETGDVRMFMSDLGHMELLKIGDSYRDRFANVNAFLAEFYEDVLRAKPCRRFNLLDPSGRGDWSAHVFPEDDIAFIGLSSCDRNDRYWHGASFHGSAIVAAQKHLHGLREEFPNMLFAGVWHHGFDSEVSRPDRLTMRDVGLLYNTGLRLGFHGHTHTDKLARHDVLTGRLTIVATGSLGAGPADLPPGVGNQFSIVHVYPRRVDVALHKRDHQGDVYEQQAVRQLPLDRSASATEAGRPRAGRHTRRWRVNRDGIAEITVSLEQLHASTSLPLAVVTPPFCSVMHGVAETNRGKQRVEATDLPDGRVRFQLPDPNGVRECTFTYYLSNAVALTEAERAMLPPREPWYTNIEPTEDARSHTVRVECDTLRLELSFEEGIAQLRSARPLVERPRDDGSDSYWEKDSAETKRVAREFSFAETKREVTWSIVAPIVGHRYAIVFRPGDGGPVYPDAAASLARALLERCRGEAFATGSIRDRITKALRGAIGTALCTDGPIGDWTGFLWHPDRRKLFASFGDFPPQGWAARFAAGDGVAGHAFRHSYTVAWRRPPEGATADGRTATIYKETPEHEDAASARYAWVINTPLLVEKKGPSIGVVGFARSNAISGPERELKAMAENLKSQASQQLENKLMKCVNSAFWLVLAGADELTQEQREYASSRLEAIGVSDGDDRGGPANPR